MHSSTNKIFIFSYNDGTKYSGTTKIHTVIFKN